MPRKKPATKKAVRTWIIHFFVYAICIFCMWFFTYHGKSGWIYPWPSWFTIAWTLSLAAHACLVWSSYEDKSYDEFKRQTLN